MRKRAPAWLSDYFDFMARQGWADLFGPEELHKRTWVEKENVAKKGARWPMGRAYSRPSCSSIRRSNEEIILASVARPKDSHRRIQGNPGAAGRQKTEADSPTTLRGILDSGKPKRSAAGRRNEYYLSRAFKPRQKNVARALSTREKEKEKLGFFSGWAASPINAGVRNR